MSDIKHLDQAALKELKDIMEDDFALLVKTFIDDSIQRVDVIAKALDDCDAEALRQSAHSFKGSSSNICAPILADLCKELESLGNEKQLDDAPAYFAKVKLEFDCVKSSLESLITT